MHPGAERELNTLIQATADGDEEAFTEIVEKLFLLPDSWLYQRIARQFRNLDKQGVDNVLQRAMWKIWKYAGSFRGKTDESARRWIYKTAFNLAVDEAKAARIFHDLEFLDAVEYPSTVGVPDLDDVFEDDASVRTFLEKLTERQHQVCGLLSRGYKQVEIAGELGITKGRVAQLVRRLRQKASVHFGVSFEDEL